MRTLCCAQESSAHVKGQTRATSTHVPAKATAHPNDLGQLGRVAERVRQPKLAAVVVEMLGKEALALQELAHKALARRNVAIHLDPLRQEREAAEGRRCAKSPNRAAQNRSFDPSPQHHIPILDRLPFLRRAGIGPIAPSRRCSSTGRGTIGAPTRIAGLASMQSDKRGTRP